MNEESISAARVSESIVPIPRTGAGSTPSPALHSIEVRPIPTNVTKELLVSKHYLHSWPGGTKLAFGVFAGQRLMGAATLGVGPFLGYCLVDGSTPDDCITLTRLWLSDELPKNGESHVIGIIIRALRRNTNLKFIIAYADPDAGHVGTIYQATNWIYTGLSSATPLYEIDGVIHHSRSFAASFGTHSIQYFAERGIQIKTIPQSPKHRYLYFIDPNWKKRLKVMVLPYPKKEVAK
jgi:hypothetical protein